MIGVRIRLRVGREDLLSDFSEVVSDCIGRKDVKWLRCGRGGIKRICGLGMW